MHHHQSNSPQELPDKSSRPHQEGHSANDHLHELEIKRHMHDLLRWEDEGGACAEDSCHREDLRKQISNAEPRLDSPQTTPETGPAQDQQHETLAESQHDEKLTAEVGSGASREPSRFEEFWPTYLEAHSKPATRLVHYMGPPLGAVFAGGCLLTGNPLAALATPLVVYGPLFLSHWLIEGNQPKSFQNALWSARAELKMFFLGLTGRIGGELEKHGIEPSKKEAPIRKFLRGIGLIRAEKSGDSSAP